MGPWCGGCPTYRNTSVIKQPPHNREHEGKGCTPVEPTVTVFAGNTKRSMNEDVEHQRLHVSPSVDATFSTLRRHLDPRSQLVPDYDAL